MKVAILYDVLERDGSAYRVGGIQTYVLHLAELCLNAGWEAMLFQPATHDFESLIGRVPVCGIGVVQAPNNGGIAIAQPPSDGKEYSRVVLPVVRRWANKEPLVVVFGHLGMAMQIPGASTIGIQHGIGWDIDTSNPQTPWKFTIHIQNPQHSMIRQIADKLLHQTPLGRWRTKSLVYDGLINYVSGYEDVDVRVCVDYNFPNWYRTIRRNRSNKPEHIIINPAEIATPHQLAGRNTRSGLIRIIFARRFYWYRGTGIMAEAGKHLLSRHANVRITFAGEGPDGESLKQYFSGESRVRFITYRPEESMQVYLEHDVAVNASLGSEGSSLSVGEAMGAGCAVVATNIGGVTNMILDGYNGLLVNPDTESLYQGLLRVVTDAELRVCLGQVAWQTAGKAFSLDRWSRKWREVILEAASQK